MRSHVCVLRCAAALVLSLGALPAAAGTLLYDDFVTLDTTTVWEGATGVEGYGGTIDIAQPDTVDGRSCVYLESDLAPMERKGFWTQQTFPTLDEAVAKLKFRTTSGSIDGLMELSLHDPATNQRLSISVFASHWGAHRNVYSVWDVGGVSGTHLEEYVWEYDQWYRFVIDSNATETTFLLLEDDDDVLYEHTVAIPISGLTDFKVALCQYMGTPYEKATAHVDELTLTPEPACLSLLVIGAIALLRRR